MLILSKSITEQEVLSLQTGGVIARTESPIFNPDNLKIEGFFCIDTFSKGRIVLLSQDIRDHIKQGFVVNDHDVLTDAEDLVRLQKIMRMQFQLVDKVVATKKKKLGKVLDYALDSETLYVKKLYVGQSLLKNLSHGQLSVDRNQIIEITDKKIIIKDPLQLTPVEAQRAPKPAVG